MRSVTRANSLAWFRPMGCALRRNRCLCMTDSVFPLQTTEHSPMKLFFLHSSSHHRRRHPRPLGIAYRAMGSVFPVRAPGRQDTLGRAGDPGAGSQVLPAEGEREEPPSRSCCIKYRSRVGCNPLSPGEYRRTCPTISLAISLSRPRLTHAHMTFT